MFREIRFEIHCRSAIFIGHTGTVEYKELFKALHDSDLTRAAHKGARAKRGAAVAAAAAAEGGGEGARGRAGPRGGGGAAADREWARQRAEGASLALVAPTELECPLFCADGRVDRREASKAVELVVGGQVFRAMPELFLRYPESLLGRIFTGRHPEVRPNRHGRYFFDRDPRHFEPVLTFYRSGQLVVPGSVAVQGVMQEARFFGMEAQMFGRLPVAAARPSVATHCRTPTANQKPLFPSPRLARLLPGAMSANRIPALKLTLTLSLTLTLILTLNNRRGSASASSTNTYTNNRRGSASALSASCCLEAPPPCSS